MSISVLILTYNEEKNLRRLLKKVVTFSDDIIILDSQSTDSTQTVAEYYNCRVVVRAFDTERNQREFGNKLQFKNDWVYSPDADEIPSDELIAEMNEVARGCGECVAYEMRFKNYLDGKWVRRSTDYPVWVIRFFKPAYLNFDREINLRYKVDGAIGRFCGHFDHYPFSKGLDWWVSKHNIYSTKEAFEAAKIIGSLSLRMAIINIFRAKSSKERRIALKEFSFLMPFRGGLRFVYSYFIRLGILDGRPGLKYCLLISFYEFLISAKLSEIRHHKNIN